MMSRKASFSVKALGALAGLLAVAGAAPAATIESAPVTFTNSATTLNFDFSGAAELGQIKAGSKLVEIRSEYTFNPGSGQTGPLELVAELVIPPVTGGAQTNVGFSSFVPAGMTVQGGGSKFAEDGLVFSNTVISSLLANGDYLEGALQGLGTEFDNINAFFAAGGTVTGAITLITKDPEGGGNPGGGGTPGGGQVPEPASMLVWGAVALGAAARRRMTKTPAAPAV